jgi:hypothetical protein
MSTLYTYSEARQRLAAVLDEAAEQGEVRIKRRDGQVFIIRPATRTTSPLDVPGINLGMSAEEIVAFVQEGRSRVADESVED